MKLTLLLLTLLGGLSYAQEVERVPTENTSTEFPPNSVEYDSLKSIQVYNDSLNQRISLIDQNLNSIQIKWDWIMNNPEEKVKATDEGWFDKMNAIKQELLEEKQLLLNAMK